MMKSRVCRVLFTVFCLGMILMGAGPGHAAFYRGLHAGDYGMATDVVVYPDGRVTLVGCDTSISGNLNMTLIECYSDGGLRSATSYGMTGSDVLMSGAPGPSGSTYYGGYTNGGGLPQVQYMVVKQDDMGDLEWVKTLQFTTESRIMDLDVSPVEEIFIFGRVLGTPMPHDVAACKLDSAGNLQWCARLNDGYFNFFAECVEATSDGGCIAAGSMGSTGIEVLVVFKLDASGNLEWHRHINAPYYLTAYSIFETAPGEYTLGGLVLDIDSGSFLVRLDASGNLVWARKISHSVDHAHLMAMVPAAGGGYIASGAFGPEGGSYVDCLIFKLDDAGAVEWATRIGDGVSLEEVGYGIDELPSGEIVITGSRVMSPPTDRDFLYIRLESDGTIPECPYVQSVPLDSVDITAELNSYTRDVTVITDLPVVADITSSIVTYSTNLTEYSLCDGIEVPSLSVTGIIGLLLLMGSRVRRSR